MKKKFPAKKKPQAQASIETLVILAAGLFILMVFMSVVFDQMTIQQITQQKNITQQSANLLVNEINDIFFLGPGSKKQLTLFIPDLVELQNSTIENNTINFFVVDTNISATAKTRIVGDWPSKTGSHVFVLEAFNDFVSITPTNLSFFPNQMNYFLNKDSFFDSELIITNQKSVLTNFVFFIESNNQKISSDYNNELISLQKNGSDNDSNTIPLRFDCDNSIGLFEANIVFLNATTKLTYPVKLNCLSSQSKLVIDEIPIINQSIGLEETYFVNVCNNSVNDFDNIRFSVDGNIQQIVFASLKNKISANSCEQLKLRIFSENQGNFFGKISVSAQGLNNSVNLNVQIN